MMFLFFFPLLILIPLDFNLLIIESNSLKIGSFKPLCSISNMSYFYLEKERYRLSDNDSLGRMWSVQDCVFPLREVVARQLCLQLFLLFLPLLSL